MAHNLPESDWKLFRKHKDKMLEVLSARLNGKSKEILENPEKSEHERYIELYRHVRDSDEIVAICFNDWRRSNFTVFATHLARQNIIPKELWDVISDGTRERIERLRDL